MCLEFNKMLIIEISVYGLFTKLLIGKLKMY